MLSTDNTHGIIISQTPVLMAGIGSILKHHFPEYILNYYSCVEEIDLLQLKRARLVIVDIADEIFYARRRCQNYYSLFSQSDSSRWIFFTPHTVLPVAMEFLLRPRITLLSSQEPVEGVINAIRHGYGSEGEISRTLMFEGMSRSITDAPQSKILTLSERKVLRLLGEGWGVKQAAMLLKKSNKTVSAQKNSAMRRLSLKSDADLYIWINSNQGMAELNSGAI
ncbi:helix-turn-helix domain-containing protein [Kosakonia oryziphila]|jgi:Response regulator containing a CheY-like receiver domain and an HTH DNA-binding domain|uniref:DNA-binding response regulator, NarL/FixJ family, contains REC and HTH domains n=1 Tax=Kosakonia oryziphila TaxID=1005667 RepID=A0A1C3YVL5_9ENTR|nr:LuxR C-terminal-related transcriptional regulator [Kosakonia oryziphila]SCB74161.1 DNA-binding response regulator, NarL/FixJ family, contains REC and HTH domains [Kosakonia oryziphila]